jgi:hypothetical protein
MNPTEPLDAPSPREQEPEKDPEPLGAGFDFTDPNSPLAPYYLRAGHVVAVVLLALLFLLYNFVPVFHTDIWGHLKFGKWMIDHGALPDHEPFSPFADHDARYVHFQWLSQAGFYLLYRAGEWLAGGDPLRQMEGGVELLHAGHVVLAVACFALLLLAYRRKAESLPLACAGLVCLVALTPSFLVILRPQVVGVALYAALLFVLGRPVLSVRALVGVPLLMVLWANLHGSYAVGLVLLALVLAGRMIEAFTAEAPWSLRRVWRDSQVRRLFAVLVLSVAAVAVLNPHGPSLFLYTVRLGRHPNIPFLDEWQPLNFGLFPAGGTGIYLATLVLLALTQLVSPRPFSATQVLLIAVFGVWPCFQQRMMAWWLPLVPWLALPLWAAVADRRDWRWTTDPSIPSFRKTLLAGLLIVVALLWFTPVRWLIARHPRSLDLSVSQGTPWRLAAQLQAPGGSQAAWLPELGKALRDHYPEGRYQGRVFATETLGDYLFWALPPQTPVLIYTHLHLFPAAHWAECVTVKTAGPGWWEVLDRHGVNLVVFEPELFPDLARALRRDPTWKVVRDETGDRSKRAPRDRMLIALRKQPLTSPETR